MEDLKLNRINKGDSQDKFSDKLNENFSRVAEYYGGPYGKSGLSGMIGERGKVGPIGSKGLRGERGSFWFISSIEPTENIIEGDFWLNIADSNKVSRFINSEWIYQNIELKASEQFKRIFGVDGPEFRDALIQSSSNPSTNTLVLNSKEPGSDTLNPQYSRVVLETTPGSTADFDQSTQPLLEFSKVINGVLGDHDKSPIFIWESPGTSSYDLLWDIRRGGFEFTIEGSLGLYSNSGSIIMESEVDRGLISAGGISLNTSADVLMRDISGTAGAIRLTSPNFTLGKGTGQDLSELTSPVNISTTISGYTKKSLTVSNYIDKRGDGIHISAEYTTNNGNLWTSKLDNVNLIQLNKNGQIKFPREIGIRKFPTVISTETHGSYNGTTYNWLGIFPSTSTGSSGVGKVIWDGEEELIINTTGVSNRGVYLNVNELSQYYMRESSSISFSIKTQASSQLFNAIGIGGGTGASNYYPNSSNQNEFSEFGTGAFIIDVHLVKYPGDTPGGAYGLFYEAHGVAGAIETGILTIL